MLVLNYPYTVALSLSVPLNVYCEQWEAKGAVIRCCRFLASGDFDLNICKPSKKELRRDEDVFLDIFVILGLSPPIHLPCIVLSLSAVHFFCSLLVECYFTTY